MNTYSYLGLTTRKQILIALAIYAFIWIWGSGFIAYALLGLNWKYASPLSIFIMFSDSVWNELSRSSQLKILGSAILPSLPLIAIISSPRYGRRKLYGDSREATLSEIKDDGMLDGEGMILGKYKGKYLQAGGGEHALVYAPTGAGKGVGYVIPTCLTWQGSLICTDMKLENYKVTSNYRKKCGNKVFVFAPGMKETHRVNFFDLIDSNSPDRIDGLQTIAHIICPDNPNSSDGNMWAAEGRNLLIAYTLYLWDKGEYVNFENLKNAIKGSSDEEIKQIGDFHGDEIDPVANFNFNTFLRMGDKQRGGVLTELTSKLSIFDNPLVAEATSRSDFDLRTLKSVKTTIYLGCTPGSLPKVSFLFNTFFQFFLSLNTVETPDKKKHPHKTLLLMDEFTNLGRMDILKTGVSYLRGYGIRAMPIIQGTAQLQTLYTESGLEEFIQNFRYRVTSTPNSQKECEKISAELGTQTVTNISDSRGGLMAPDKSSESLSKASRALLLPQEVKVMPKDKSILMAQAMHPIFAEKIKYYEDPFFEGKFWNPEAPETTENRMYDPIPSIWEDVVKKHGGKLSNVDIEDAVSPSNEVVATNRINIDSNDEDSLKSAVDDLVNSNVADIEFTPQFSEGIDPQTTDFDALAEKHVSENCVIEEYGFTFEEHTDSEFIDQLNDDDDNNFVVNAEHHDIVDDQAENEDSSAAAFEEALTSFSINDLMSDISNDDVKKLV